jgi:hypothetical protein
MYKILVGLISLVFTACSANAQSRGQLALPDLGSGVHKSCPTCAQPDNPFWHAANDQEGAAPAGFAFNQNSAITTIDLRTYCSQPDGYAGAGTRVVTLVTGSLPTGISLGTSQLTGTPTVVESTSAAFRCTLDGVGIDDQSFSFDVTGTDTTAPAVPANLDCGPTTGSTTSSLTCTWDAVTDPSTPVVYPIRYANTEALCNSASNSDNTLLETSVDTTAALPGWLTERRAGSRFARRTTRPIKGRGPRAQAVQPPQAVEVAAAVWLIFGPTISRLAQCRTPLCGARL